MIDKKRVVGMPLLLLKAVPYTPASTTGQEFLLGIGRLVCKPIQLVCFPVCFQRVSNLPSLLPSADRPKTLTL